MPATKDPQRRPVFIDRVNDRFLADPAIGSKWQVIDLTPGMFSAAPANTVLGRYGASGAVGYLTSDVTVDLINTATLSTINAARVVAGSTSGAGVLQLTDSVSSTSTTTAATPAAVKSAYDLASNADTTAAAALPRAGGTMTGTITFAAGQTISGYAELATAQSFTAAQRGSIAALSDGASITPDFSTANNFSVTLGGNRTLENPTNLTAGQSGCIWITQDGTGSRTLSYGTYWDFTGGTAPTLTTTASAVDCLVYAVQSSTKITATLVANLS